MKWRVQRLVSVSGDASWTNGFSDPIFHDDRGSRFCVSWDDHWVSCFGADGRLRWTCGPKACSDTPNHIFADLQNPSMACALPGGAVLISCFGNRRFFEVHPENGSARVLIAGDDHDLKDTGYGVVDHQGYIWVHEITGCRVWKFDPDGEPVLTLGDGTPGFHPEDVPLHEARFNWIYDIRCGPDGNVYVLDSRNFAVRMIDVTRSVVTRVAGTGRPGYTGDGGDARLATFGSNPGEKFDGPWALCLDDHGNVYVGDMHNRVIRMIERSSGRITTIAGRPHCRPDDRNDPLATDPLEIGLPRIAGLHYFRGRLFITQERGEFVVLERVASRRDRHR